MTTIDISPEAVELLCAIHEGYGQHGTVATLRALSAALTQSRAETAAAYELAAHEAWKYGGSGFEKAIRTIATPDQTAALDKLIAEAVKPYVEALEFYADEENYETQYERMPCDCCTDIFEPINEDKGAKARNAILALIGEKK